MSNERPEHGATVGRGTALTRKLRALLAVLAQHDRFLTSARRNRPRQFAAAALVRCRALLDGMCTLEERSRADVVGVLGRSLLETWLVGTYVLLKGNEEALNEVLAGYAKAGRIINERLDFGDKFAVMIDRWTVAVGPNTTMPPFEELARRVTALLEAAGEGLDATRLYDALYRSHSTFDAHGGAGAILRYLEYDEKAESDSVIENPGAAIERQEVISASLVCLLARLVFKEFRVVVQGLDAAWHEFADLVAASDGSRSS